MSDVPPIPYMQCMNLVTINDSYDPLIPYIECGNLVTGSPPHVCYDLNEGTLKLSMTLIVPHTLYGMWKPYNSQYPMVSHTLYGMWEPCNWVPHMYDVGTL